MEIMGKSSGNKCIQREEQSKKMCAGKKNWLFFDILFVGRVFIKNSYERLSIIDPPYDRHIMVKFTFIIRLSKIFDNRFL